MDPKTRKKLEEIIIITLVSLIAVFVIKKTFFILFPVFLGFVFSEAMVKSLKRLSPVSETVRKVLVVLMLLIFFAFLSLIIILLFEKSLEIVSDLGDGISDNSGRIEEWFDGIVSFCEEKLEKVFRRDMHSEVSEYLLSVVKSFLGKAVEAVPEIIKKLAGFLPRAFVSLTIFIFSAYYFSCDRKLLPMSFAGVPFWEKAKKYTKKAISSMKKTFSAYSILFLLTFSELLTGFLILGIKDPFVVAFSVSLVDILPVLGVGTVLVPWSAVFFISGNVKKGVGLAVLWLVTFTARQFAEPKIVGKKLGIHPVISLVSVIAGLYFFGFFGMLLFPLALSVFFDTVKKSPSQ